MSVRDMGWVYGLCVPYDNIARHARTDGRRADTTFFLSTPVFGRK
jgi:hypothetical protein